MFRFRQICSHLFTGLFFGLLLVLPFSLLFTQAFASDLAKEQRLTEQIADYIMDGEAVYLTADKHQFLSIYMEAEAQPAKGTVIILHGRGFHPNWPKVVYPLRTGLTHYNWNTLAIQLPVLSNDSSYYDYLNILHESHPRISAALNFLQKKQQQNIILLSHSCGTYMGLSWLLKNQHAGIKAFIGIGMGPTDYGQPMLEPLALEKIKIPVLDIRGDNDYNSVQINAPRRWKHIQQAGNPKSEQLIVEDSGHYYEDTSDLLLQEIVNWLDRL